VVRVRSAQCGSPVSHVATSAGTPLFALRRVGATPPGYLEATDRPGVAQGEPDAAPVPPDPLCAGQQKQCVA
jgi:hypothetical protein